MLTEPEVQARREEACAEVRQGLCWRKVGPQLLAACQTMLDLYGLPTQQFVQKYGAGMTTRQLGDMARAAVAKARRIQEQQCL